MATLDDKILGEKLQNYCSSSSDDEDDCKQPKGAKFIPEAQVKDQEALMQKGISTNVSYIRVSLSHMNIFKRRL